MDSVPVFSLWFEGNQSVMEYLGLMTPLTAAVYLQNGLKCTAGFLMFVTLQVRQQILPACRIDSAVVVGLFLQLSMWLAGRPNTLSAQHMLHLSASGIPVAAARAEAAIRTDKKSYRRAQTTDSKSGRAAPFILHRCPAGLF